MIYLDNAATSFPKPPNVVKETMRCMKKYCGNPGRGSHKMSVEAAKKIYETRKLIDDMFCVGGAENVIFTLNTTYALNIAIKSIIKDGDQFIISDIEHNSVIRPLYSNKAVNISVFDSFADDDSIIRQIETLITKKTKAVVVSHASNILPVILPIRKIGALCKRHDIYFIVDAAQSAGIYEINMREDNIDMLCMPSHKGLLGPQGCGILAISPSLDIKSLKTLFEGGNGINSNQTFMPDFTPEKFEAGTLPTPAIAGLCEGIKFINNISMQTIRENELSLGEILIEFFNDSRHFEVYTNKPCGTVLFNVKGKSADMVSEILDSNGIYIRSGLHCSPFAHKKIGTSVSGAVRVSFGAFNTQRDVNELIDVIKSKII